MQNINYPLTQLNALARKNQGFFLLFNISIILLLERFFLTLSCGFLNTILGLIYPGAPIVIRVSL